MVGILLCSKDAEGLQVQMLFCECGLQSAAYSVAEEGWAKARARVTAGTECKSLDT